MLKNRGFKVANQKLDPYINIDPGTMSPYEHGEVFVTEDGAETDLDLGHYERFTDENLSKFSSITSGKIYSEVLEKERRGDYLGKTVQVIPHVTDAIKEKIYNFKDKVDFIITEVGGTVGDIEGLAMIEAIRQIGMTEEYDKTCYIHVTYLPYLSGSNELKSKPTSHSVKELQGYGIRPDVLVCRADRPLNTEIKKKIALYSNVRMDSVIENSTVENLYEIPLMLEKNGLANAVCQKLNIKNNIEIKDEWNELLENIKLEKSNKALIGIVGKYIKLEDSYLSIVESIKHAGIKNNAKIEIKFINSEELESGDIKNILADLDGIIVPGGFGERGIKGMILTIKYARENNIPFLGICLGMQMAVIEYAKNVLKLDDATSEEFNPNAKNKVIHLMEDQKGIIRRGGTMRLGAYPCTLRKDSYSAKIYGNIDISERHRHRFEFNNEYRELFEKNNLVLSGKSPDGELVEIVELPETIHNFFVAVQFHPEFKSRPNKPAPLFVEFVKKSMKEEK